MLWRSRFDARGKLRVALLTAGALLVSAIGSGQGAGLTGFYYDDAELMDLRLCRTDGTVNFEWGQGSPDPLIEPDTFSVRWVGQVEAEFTETYTFYTITDDGVRLWVNEELLIDHWHGQVPTEWSGTIDLTAGVRYDIRMEYFEGGSNADAKLFWSSPSLAREIIPASRLYPARPIAVAVTGPSDGSVFVAGSNIRITADAAADMGISRVEFFEGSVFLGEATTSPYFFDWNGVPAGSYSFTVRATDGGGCSSQFSNPVNIVVTGLDSVTLNTANVTGGSSAIGTVNLTGPAPPGGAVVELSSSDSAVVTVPASVRVAADVTSAAFTIETVPVSIPMAVTLTASYAGALRTAVLTVQPPMLSLLTISPSIAEGGVPVAGTVSLNGPAPTGGVAVSLTSSHPFLAAVPSSITVIQWSSSASFSIPTSAAPGNIAISITASHAGVNRVASVELDPAVGFLRLTENGVLGGSSGGMSITLTGPAPFRLFPITMTSSNPAVAWFPNPVSVPPGAVGTANIISTAPVAVRTSVTITASAGSVAKSAILVLNPAPLAVSFPGASVFGPGSIHGKVTLSSGSGIVFLGSSNSAVGTVPSFVNLPGGAVNFLLTTYAVAAPTSITITAQYGSAVRTIDITVVPSVTLSSLSVVPTTVVGPYISVGTVTLTGPPAFSGSSVLLSSSDPAYSIVPGAVMVFPGDISAKFFISSVLTGTIRPITVTATYGLSRTASYTIMPP